MSVFEKIGIELVCENAFEKACFSSAVVSSFVLNAASVNNKYIAVNSGGSNEINDNSKLVAANLQNFEVIKKFDLVKALSRNANVDDKLSLEFRVDDLFCGQWEFRGITSVSSTDKYSFECGSIILIIDDVSKDDYQNEINLFFKKLTDITFNNPNGVCKPYVMFAVACSEFDMNKAREFTEKNFRKLMNTFREKNISYGIMPYSSDSSGGSEPVPYNVDKLICDVIYNASKYVKKILEGRKSDFEKSINDNIGVFNRRNFRWEQSMHEMRRELSEIIQACYAMDNAIKYFKQ